jgi:hypothetical protein
MEFIGDRVPNVRVTSSNCDFVIKSMQYLDEDEQTVTLKCAEYINVFKRGFVCDLGLQYSIVNGNEELLGDSLYPIKDLILVYVNKEFELDSFPAYRYIFFK